ncbi:membrane bound o-acyl transferase family protein [Hirsutella rhossiliensis]|uniref:Membrane bound o-acyl transferase family domain-containing protein n=1 Tax=Hirsutella rhossiliensis TaxID=111463 RepID=A0A9P8SLT2_9HYPO|nr:membrane bound o-acyl transferase family domain-containing protein [Hirsutella rhossiliensis]KAH0967276.1 membrane bound o-acyl transferase family domain-containing protein [Hirsutella rhossiliensis]
MDNLSDAAQTARRAAFSRAVAEGRLTPLVIPYSLLGAFFVPVLWLTIPHARRPWLYHTRWLVMAFVVAFNINVIRQTSSSRFAFAYATGLMAAWGIISNLSLLIWTRPQFDAARAVRVSTRPAPVPTTKGPSRQASARWAGDARQRRRRQVSVADSTVQQQTAVFVWQPFPADGPFLQRLGWALDLACSFRGSGWNWSITSIPHPQIPPVARPGELVDLDSIPRVSKSGYECCLTEREFVRRRLASVAVMYLVLDLGSVLMVKDPYFVLGPGHSDETPSYLGGMPPWLLLAYRELLTVAGILSAIQGYFSLHDLIQYWLSKLCFPSRAAPWFHTSVFGSFSQLLDRGLAGWWGASWHQTFRHQFLAPATYLVKHGYLNKGSRWAAITAAFVSFLQSGLLHASGSMTSTPGTKPWHPVAFFLLQVVGIIIEKTLHGVMVRCFPNPSRVVTRAINLLWVTSWLYMTGVFFVDDFAATGAWLMEPVPMSPLRWLGYGHPTDHWWRWDCRHFFKWHSGKHWWESGIAI